MTSGILAICLHYACMAPFSGSGLGLVVMHLTEYQWCLIYFFLVEISADREHLMAQHSSVASMINQIRWYEYIAIEDLHEMRALDKFSRLFCVMHFWRQQLA